MSDLSTISFADRIRDTAERLTGADNKALRAILDDPQAAALLSVSELAAKAQVHEATATRLAQKLGYRGYPALRDALRAQYIARTDNAARVARSVERVTTGQYLVDLVATELAALAQLPDALPQDRLDLAAEALTHARRIFVFARGHALALADLAERRLRRYGFDIVILAGENRTIAERLAGLRPDDALLCFAFRTKPKSLDAILGHAHRLGVPSVLIADLPALALSATPSVALAAPRGRSGDEFQTLTVPMAILNALVLTIAGRHTDLTIGALDAVSELIQQLDPP